MIVLNEDQQAAEDAIVAAYLANEHEFLLLGGAGVGKTTLMQSFARRVREIKREGQRHAPRIVATAPTHKAVQVLRRKLVAAGLADVPTATIHSVLGLKPTVDGTEKQVLKRNPAAPGRSHEFEIIALDECSMDGKDLQKYIDEDLCFHFVLYIGDDAQLPPVNEVRAPIFDRIPERLTYRLTKIVRQEEGNPILAAAAVLRNQQGTDKMDWSWLQPVSNGRKGIYHSGDATDAWLKNAFTSSLFKNNNDEFRYIAYTNWKVKEVNRKIRGWIYGETETPYVVGEQVLCRNPVIDPNTDRPIFSTNEEAIVTSIESDVRTYSFSMMGAAAGQQALRQWSVDLPVWIIGLKRLQDEEDEESETLGYATMVQNESRYMDIDRKLVTEAKANRQRWREYFAFKERLADIRPVYALTAHSSQGSTFGIPFIDVPDIANRASRDVLECQKLFYVALTRASKAAVLVGV